MISEIGVSDGLYFNSGVAAPSIAGPIADIYGLPSVMWFSAGVALAAAFAALFLTETAPCKVLVRQES